MELSYSYQKKRAEFGKQCMFNDKGPDLIDNYPANRRLLNDYIARDPVDASVQYADVQAEHEINTYRAEYTVGGMNHTEGGWPKDVNIFDEDQTKRYKRKVEKEEQYPHIMMQLCKNMEECILQNNAINIYQQYYTDVELTPLVEPSSLRTVNVFTDQHTTKRPITHISWCPDGGNKLAVSHCDMKYQQPIGKDANKSYIWEMENPNVPNLVLNPNSQSVCLEYNPKDPNIIAGGQYNGLCAIFDTRTGSDPVDYTLMEQSHRDPVHGLLWIASKTGNDFYTGSTDGMVKWWDYRKLEAPVETLILDPVARLEDQDLSRALGATVLEFESTIPTRFMIGTENGIVISGNRKGKLPLEKMVARYNAHLGPVLAVQRNAAFAKNFITIGDWMVRLWSEDCKESSIIWTSYHKCRLLDGGWSPTRYSVFFTCRSDGVIDVWDILQCQQKATIGVKICDNELTSMRTHDAGKLICIGSKMGTAYIIELSENLTYSNKNDKVLLTAMFERESHREKILEARNREIRLRQRAKSTMSGSEDIKVFEFENKHVTQATQDFFEIIDKETRPSEAEVEAEEGEPEEDPLAIEDQDQEKQE